MDTLNSRNAFADTSRDEEDLGSPVQDREPNPPQAEGEPTPDDKQDAFMKLAHAL